MRRSVLTHSFILSATLLAAVASSAVAGDAFRAHAMAGDAARVGVSGGVDGILGFELGEERRYISGPPGSLRNDGAASWSIRLDQVVERDSRRLGVFTMTHEQHRNGLSFAGGIAVYWKYEGELLINEFGFPEALRFSWFEEHTGEAPWRGDPVFVSYTFEDGEFRKVVRVPGQEWEYPVPIATHGDLDLDARHGLFLLRSEPADIDFFTNPALLEFALPRVLESSWEQRTLFFKPTIPARYPSSRWIRTERNRRRSLERNYDKITLESGEEESLDIGGRTLQVRRVRISGPMRDAYVDEFGRVVRVDLDLDSWTRRNRHIRILFPSEY